MPEPKRWPDKDPDERLEYGFNWSPRNIGDDVIEEEEITAEVIEGDVQILSSEVAADGRVRNAKPGQGSVHWLAGGTAGTECKILLRAGTRDLRSMDQTMLIKIAER